MRAPTSNLVMKQTLADTVSSLILPEFDASPDFRAGYNAALAAIVRAHGLHEYMVGDNTPMTYTQNTLIKSGEQE